MDARVILREKRFALCPRMTTEEFADAYASPSVSNIAQLKASGADLPAHTTNWNAG